MSTSKKIFSLIGVLIVFSLLMAACKPAASTGGEGVQIDKNAKVEIWIDAAREESAGKFIDKYPDTIHADVAARRLVQLP